MALLLGTNSPLFLGSQGITLSAGYFDSTYVSHACVVGDYTAASPIYFDAGATDTVWIRWHMKTAGQGSAQDGNAGPWVYDAAGNRLFFFEVSNGNWQATFNGDTQIADAMRYIGTGLKTHDLKFQITGGVLYVEWWLDGSLMYSGSAACVGGRTLPRRLNFASTDANHLYISELLIMDTPTIGRHLMEILPLSQGADDAWDGGFAELGDNDALSIASSGVVGARESSIVSDYSGPVTGGIEAVVVESIGNKTIGSPGGLTHYLKIAAVNYDGSVKPLDDVPTRTDEIWAINPATGLNWAFADVTGAARPEIGLKAET